MKRIARIALFIVVALPLAGCADKARQVSSKQESPTEQAAEQPRQVQSAASAAMDGQAAPPPKKAFTAGYTPGKGSGSFLASTSAGVRAAAMAYPAPPDKQDGAHAPLSLTASDGTGLELVSLAAKAVVSGPLAFTELHLTFKNPEPRVREGRFSITLPDGAAISRLAMKLPDGWQEAEVVERQAARRMYEDFLHRRQDPALMEKKAGNAFRARIFPIPAGGTKGIKISYSQEMTASDSAYRLPLRGLPRMQKLEIQAIVGTEKPGASRSSLGGTAQNQRVVRVSKENFIPDRDFTVDPQEGIAGLRHQNLVLTRIKPAVPSRTAAIPSLLVLLDTSASRAPGFAGQVEAMGALLRALAARHGAKVPLTVLCFDQTLEVIFDGEAGQFSTAHQRHILARRPLGASNLGAALRWAAQIKGHRRVLLVSDGVATMGKTSSSELRQLVKQLKPGVDRMDALMVGGIRDEPLLKGLVSGTLSSDGVVLDGQELSSEQMVARLSQVTLSGVEVEVPGARWIWPSLLSGVQPGHEVLIYADLPPEALAPGSPLTVKLAGPVTQTMRVSLAAVERPLLERAWVKARMARIKHHAERATGQSAKERQATRKQLVELSTRFRVLNDYTALLVLETEADYRRFGLDRKALADILTVGPTGIQVLRRKEQAAAGRADDTPDMKPATGPRHAGEEGSMGARRSSQDEAQRRAQNAGVLGLLKGSVPSEADEALGGLIGNQIGEAYGVGGLGLVGKGSGGGGVAPTEGTIGLGLLGTGNDVGRAPAFAEVIGPGSVGAIGRDAPSEPPTSQSSIAPLRAATSGRGGSGVSGRRVARLRGRRSKAPRVTGGRARVRGALDKGIIRRIIRRHINEVKYCYQKELQARPDLHGRVVVQFTISPTGQVVSSVVQSSTMGNRQVETCIAMAVRRWLFPKPKGGGIVIVTYPFRMRTSGGSIDDIPHPPPPAVIFNPHSGRFKEVRKLLKRKKAEAALLAALKWRRQDPGDVLALVALGEALALHGQPVLAARAYGSIIDLFPSRADMRRFAGQRLEELGPSGQALAADSYAVAVLQRPDHPNSHRMLAYALLRLGRHEQAWRALLMGARRSYPERRFAAVQRILGEDLELIAAAWLAAAPDQRRRIKPLLKEHKVDAATRPSLRFILSWETDANDVDFHIRDGRDGHASYDNPTLLSGGKLYADVTSGYGPECFTVPGKKRAFPYRLHAHYYRRGPMGYGMGRLQIIQHDGKGKLKFNQRPFIVMNDRANVDLGEITKPL